MLILNFFKLINYLSIPDSILIIFIKRANLIIYILNSLILMLFVI